MTHGIKSDREHIEGALEAAGMAWWSLEFPSGALTFSRYKTVVLGYDAKDFVHFMHFTDLIHPEDKDEAMQAMKDHYTGGCRYMKRPIVSRRVTEPIKSSTTKARSWNAQGKVLS